MCTKLDIYVFIDSNLVHMTRFCNNLHQVRSELKDRKVNKNVDI
jgi:hypothetical protein